MIRQYQLVEQVRAYDPSTDEDALNKAFVYTVKMHGSQKRASGDPYFSHPVEVAGILAGMKLDWKTIAAGLLHDTLEDTLATHDELEKQFGKDITRLVDGVTKLSQLEVQGAAAKQGENFRKLVLAMSEDIRVLLIKLADRMHNMRTLHFIKDPEKRQRIARETLELYAPLAERIGISRIKEELQDIAFGELYPDVHDSITKRMATLKEDNENISIVDRVINDVKEKLTEGGLPDADVYGREKRPYSIWRKMERLHVGFEALADIVAFRVLVENIEQCYQALGIIHGAYRAVPELFDDYISNPKPNGYRSLHTTVIGPEKRRIEIQIRTHEMHEINEMGVAAHWAYKQQTGAAKEGEQYRWLRQLLEILENSQQPEEFLEHTKLELFQDQVFCFTPKGELVALPRGGTPVDFAYAVHSRVGDSTVGAKVNSRMVPLNHVLKNGDQVEIMRSKKQAPSPTWERFVVTGKARAHIRKYLRQQQRDEYSSLGKAMLQKVFESEGATFTEKGIHGILKKFKSPADDDLYARIGAGSLPAREVFYAIFPGLKDKKPVESEPVSVNKASKGVAKISGIPIRGLIPGMALHLARCCHPVVGDRIVGIITTGKGVTAHTIDCETLESFADMPERWLDLSWDSDSVAAAEVQTGRLSVQISQATGALSALTTTIAKHDASIVNLKVVGRTPDVMDLLLDIQVKDLRHLTNIMAAIRATEHVFGVERVKGK